jgi:hypothetical protein
LDEAVATYGNWLQNELDGVDAKTAIEMRNKQGLIFAKAFGEINTPAGEEVQVKQFKDPADLFSEAQKRRGVSA